MKMEKKKKKEEEENYLLSHLDTIYSLTYNHSGQTLELGIYKLFLRKQNKC